MKTKILKLSLSILISSSLFSPSEAEAQNFFRRLFGLRTNNGPTVTVNEEVRSNVITQEQISNEVKINNKCFEFYKKNQSSVVLNKATNKAVEKKEVSDLKSFGQAMTEGMLLNAEQADLFEVYRKIYFGDPNTSVNNETLKSVTDILKKYPDLQKSHFREYEISTVEKVYESSESLTKYLKSQIQTAGQVRSNLLQIEANLGFWKKIFDYQDQVMPEGLTKEEQKDFSRKQKEKFQTYLNRMISRKNRELLADLKNDKEDYQKKAKSLFTTLKYIQEWMDKKGRNTQAIRQAMVDLIHTVGYGNQAIQILLKSKNAMEKIEGLKKVIDERDAVAMDLGYAGHFQELQAGLKIEFPTGLSKNENPSQNIQKLEQEILSQGKFTTKPTETVRVRSLSIQEAPFRSCLGGSDCSTRTYFSKALDPNYNYFTMTDALSNSNGHVTVVLGEAINPQTNQKEKVAFIDKLQNVPNQKIPSFLQAVSLSLRERGYKLGVPEDVGDHNGLSNMDTTRHYVAQEVVSKLNQRLTTFVPHSHQYEFKNTYSRAYNKLNVKIYEPISIDKDTEIKQGKEYQNFTASKSLDKNKLIQDLLNLKNSQEPNDVLKYVSSGQVVAQLEKLGLFSVKEFEKDLGLILERKELPFNIRKQVVFEILLIKSAQGQNYFEINLKNFDDTERTQIASEIRQWSKSSDKRRKKFADDLNDKWSNLVRKSDIGGLEALSSLKLFDVNYRNESGFSALLIAIHADQKAVVEWLIKNPKLDLNYKDDLGFTDIEQARLLGKNEMADFIEQKRPEVRSRRFEVKERNDDGTPIISSVKIPAGTFRMGDKEKVTVTLTKPFEMMSVQTTQKMWKGVVDLFNQYIRNSNQKYEYVLDHFKDSPSQFKGDQNPVESVSHTQAEIWLTALNDLSGMNDPQIQSKLKELFSESHYLGKKYRLPTEAEWEYVARMRGLSTGDYAHGNTDKNLDEYAWFDKNAGSKTQPVGLKKPIIINGKPIYDIHGNVWEWLADWYGNNLIGGIDPQGAAPGSGRVMRGGSWVNGARGLRSGYRSYGVPGNRYYVVGFRLVSDIP